MSTLYRVTWEIDIDAETPIEAALEAERIQKDRESTATQFDVTHPDTKVKVICNTEHWHNENQNAVCSNCGDAVDDDMNACASCGFQFGVQS